MLPITKLANYPLIMGVLNITPDSFSDGSCYLRRDAALKQADKLIKEGADIIDIGGESTRPGADIVSADEELSRIVPVIQEIKQNHKIKISIDTYKTEVMQEVLSLGVDMINDVNAFEAPGALDVVAKANCDICIMHKKGQPKTMQNDPNYNNVVDEVYQYLTERGQDCQRAGIAAENIIIDFGFGFGKTVEHNLALVQHAGKFNTLGYRFMAAVSRKSTIGTVLNRKADQRLAGSIALAVMLYLNGASIFRVHDVEQTKDAIEMVKAVYYL